MAGEFITLRVSSFMSRIDQLAEIKLFLDQPCARSFEFAQACSRTGLLAKAGPFLLRVYRA